MTGDRLRPAALAREVLLPPVLAGAVVVGMLCGLAGAKTEGGSHARGPLAPVVAHNDLSIALAFAPVADGSATRATLPERARTWRLLGTIAGTQPEALVVPVAGTIGPCGHFGCPRPGHLHNGIDYLAPTGTPVRAAASGRVAVLESTSESSGYGNFVCLQHRPDLATCYAHLSVVGARVRAGVRVRRGEVIGRVGSTGSSSAPHLHFEVRRGPAECSDCAVDPIALLSGVAPPEIDVPRVVRVSETADEPAPPQAAEAEEVVAPAPAAELAVAAPQASVEARRRDPAKPVTPTSGGAVPELTPAPQPVPAEPPAQPQPQSQPAPAPPATTTTAPPAAAPAAPPAP
jgi:hypothetical protein